MEFNQVGDRRDHKDKKDDLESNDKKENEEEGEEGNQRFSIFKLWKAKVGINSKKNEEIQSDERIQNNQFLPFSVSLRHVGY